MYSPPLNLQEYASSTLNEREKFESEDGKLGRERHILWNHGNESASLCAVRHFATLMDQILLRIHCSSGGSIWRKILFTVANRFNIPFENATAVYFHIPHMNNQLKTVNETNW